MHDALHKRLVTRVAMLADFLALDANTAQSERERARAALDVIPEGFSDIHASLVREIQFPERIRYGEAVIQLAELIKAGSWHVSNEIRPWMRNLMESGRTEERLKPVGRSSRLFVFVAVREEKITETVAKTNEHLHKQEFPLRLWDYLCLARAHPEPFQYRSFVAVGDRVEVNLPGDYRHAPAMLMRTSSMKIEPVSLHAKPNGVERYHLVARKLDI